jgi:hypothetical protein
MLSSLIVFFRSTAAPLKKADRTLRHMETTRAPIVSHMFLAETIL